MLVPWWVPWQITKSEMLPKCINIILWLRDKNGHQSIFMRNACRPIHAVLTRNHRTDCIFYVPTSEWIIKYVSSLAKQRFTFRHLLQYSKIWIILVKFFYGNVGFSCLLAIRINYNYALYVGCWVKNDHKTANAG